MRIRNSLTGPLLQGGPAAPIAPLELRPAWRKLSPASTLLLPRRSDFRLWYVADGVQSCSPCSFAKAVRSPQKEKATARILEPQVVAAFAEATAAYLRDVELGFGVRIRRVAIDGPSDPRPTGAPRRKAEAELDRRRISCITTPDVAQLEALCERARAHLACGGPESKLPGANQLWMLVGFALFQALRRDWECLEVFPQAIAVVISANEVHKSAANGLVAQLRSTARYTGWPEVPAATSLAQIGYGSGHDRLDAYLASWVASLEERDREPLGEPPRDVIWVPRLNSAA